MAALSSSLTVLSGWCCLLLFWLVQVHLVRVRAGARAGARARRKARARARARVRVYPKPYP